MQREQYIWPTLILFLDVTHDLTAIWPDKSNKKAIDSYKVLPLKIYQLTDRAINFISF